MFAPQAIHDSIRDKNIYLFVKGEGNNETLEARKIGFLGRIWIWLRIKLGCMESPMLKVAGFIAKNAGSIFSQLKNYEKYALVKKLDKYSHLHGDVIRSEIKTIKTFLPPTHFNFTPISTKIELLENCSDNIPSFAFGPEQWNKYFGEVGEAPPLPSNMRSILKSPCPFFKDYKVENTHMLVLVPSTLNGMPFSLEQLLTIARSPRAGRCTRYRWNDSNELEAKPVEKSRWVLMAKYLMDMSLNKSYAEQAKLLEDFNQRSQTDYQIPNVIDAVTTILADFVRTGKRRLKNIPAVYTRCQEFTVEKKPLAVGGFTREGLFVCNFDDTANGFCGVAPMRVFYGNEKER